MAYLSIQWTSMGQAAFLEVIEMIGSEDEDEGDGGDGDLAQSADQEGAGTLFEEIAQVRAEAYSGEGEQEGPAAEVT